MIHVAVVRQMVCLANPPSIISYIINIPLPLIPVAVGCLKVLRINNKPTAPSAIADQWSPI